MKYQPTWQLLHTKKPKNHLTKKIVPTVNFGLLWQEAKVKRKECRFRQKRELNAKWTSTKVLQGWWYIFVFVGILPCCYSTSPWTIHKLFKKLKWSQMEFNHGRAEFFCWLKSLWWWIVVMRFLRPKGHHNERKQPIREN